MGRSEQPHAQQEYGLDHNEPNANLQEQYPPQEKLQMNTPPPIYPPSGFPMQYPPAHSPQPVQFPPPSDQSQTKYNGLSMSQTPTQYNSGIPLANQVSIGTQPWKTDLFDCMADPENAILTAVVPCLTFGQIAEIIDNGKTTSAAGALKYAFGIPCLFSCAYRTKLRTRFGLMETPASDMVTHCMFEWCALCQEFRELKLRGLDPSIGWQGNLARSNMQQQKLQQMGLIPPTNQTMNY